MPGIAAYAVMLLLGALAPLLAAQATEAAKMFHVGIERKAYEEGTF
jgi:hypothetical protein